MPRKGSRWFILLVVLTVLIGGAGYARAVPVLVAEFNLGSGSGNNVTPFTDVTSVSFGLVYDASIFINIEDFPNGPEICIGCGLRIPLVDAVPTASFDFDASNSPEFSAVIGRVTDGTDEVLGPYGFVFDGSGTQLEDSQIGVPESSLFGTPTDLVGNQIDFVRLIVNDFTLEPWDANTGTGLRFSSNVTWQFFGTPAAVPEPSSLLLLGSGLAGMALFRRKGLISTRHPMKR